MVLVCGGYGVLVCGGYGVFVFGMRWLREVWSLGGTVWVDFKTAERCSTHEKLDLFAAAASAIVEQARVQPGPHVIQVLVSAHHKYVEQPGGLG